MRPRAFRESSRYRGQRGSPPATGGRRTSETEILTVDTLGFRSAPLLEKQSSSACRVGCIQPQGSS